MAAADSTKFETVSVMMAGPKCRRKSGFLCDAFERTTRNPAMDSRRTMHVSCRPPGIDTQSMKESLFVVDFISGRLNQILFAGWQHFSLVAQCLILATVLAVAISVLVYRNKKMVSVANSVSAVGLTIPSFALIGLLVAPFGFGVRSGAAMAAVNVRCLEGLELTTLKRVPVDGRSR